MFVCMLCVYGNDDDDDDGQVQYRRVPESGKSGSRRTHDYRKLFMLLPAYHRSMKIDCCTDVRLDR